MDILPYSGSQFSTARFRLPRSHLSSSAPPRRRLFRARTPRASLPFPSQKATYHKELEAAVEVVERACHLCIDVQRSLFSSEGRIVEKKDQTPVTIADFGVQALVSLELSRRFTSLPLVAEEDSSYIWANNLVSAVVNAVTDKASPICKPLINADVLEAIDRGGKKAVVYGDKPATYWILDPIDGTKGFVEGALYVVGLALVVEGKIVLGVIGCPNWQASLPCDSTAEIQGYGNISSRPGIIMAAHVGCGAWTKRLSNKLGRSANLPDGWSRSFVDGCSLVQEASFCTSDNQTWESLPLSALFRATSNALSVGEKEILVLPVCCGSLFKYLMVATGRASVYIQHARANKIIHTWDHASGKICVDEAGGKVTDWTGEELDFAADPVERRIIYPRGGILVTSGNIHNQLLEMISTTSTIA